MGRAEGSDASFRCCEDSLILKSCLKDKQGELQGDFSKQLPKYGQI